MANSNPSRKKTIPFLILADKRTVEIASAVLQQVELSNRGTDKVSALGPGTAKSHLYGDIVEWVHDSPERTLELLRFYQDEWSALPEQKRELTYALPVRWKISANKALTKISKRFPYKQSKRGNKSLTFCVIMAFAAKYRYRIPIPE